MWFSLSADRFSWVFGTWIDSPRKKRPRKHWEKHSGSWKVTILEPKRLSMKRAVVVADQENAESLETLIE